MRRIRIESLKAENLVYVVVAFKSNSMFLIDTKAYEGLAKTATSSNGMRMSFMTEQGDLAIETVIKFKEFCDSFYRIENITVNDNLIYGYSPWKDTDDQIVVGAE